MKPIPAPSEGAVTIMTYAKIIINGNSVHNMVYTPYVPKNRAWSMALSMALLSSGDSSDITSS
mgnify:CR=1 FL=1